MHRHSKPTLRHLHLSRSKLRIGETEAHPACGRHPWLLLCLFLLPTLTAPTLFVEGTNVLPCRRDFGFRTARPAQTSQSYRGIGRACLGLQKGRQFDFVESFFQSSPKSPRENLSIRKGTWRPGPRPLSQSGQQLDRSRKFEFRPGQASRRLRDLLQRIPRNFSLFGDLSELHRRGIASGCDDRVKPKAARVDIKHLL